MTGKTCSRTFFTFRSFISKLKICAEQPNMKFCSLSLSDNAFRIFCTLAALSVTKPHALKLYFKTFFTMESCAILTKFSLVCDIPVFDSFEQKRGTISSCTDTYDRLIITISPTIQIERYKAVFQGYFCFFCTFQMQLHLATFPKYPLDLGAYNWPSTICKDP